MRVAHMKSSQDLELVRLDTECSHPIAGAMVRIYFRLSGPPPLGWPYTFTSVWNEVVYPSKRPAGVEGDRIWIDCVPEEVGTHHLQQLKSAVAQTNARHREGARQQAINASQQAELEAQPRAKLQDLNRTLYPESVPLDGNTSPRFLGSAFFGRLWRLLFPKKRKSK